jgi:hypothetical protein
MSKLYTFGCSFTEDFEPFHRKLRMNPRTDYIHEFHNGRIPKSWSELLAEKLNIDYEIYGAINCDFKFTEKFGNSNTSIFFNFTRLVKEIKEDDVVIIQWTFLERFIWLNGDVNGFTTVLPNQYPLGELPTDFYDQIIYNKSNPNWYLEIKNYQNIINELAIAKGFKVYYWSIDDRYYQYFAEDINLSRQYLLNDLFLQHSLFLTTIKNNGGKTIEEETDGKIRDTHFGETGHQVIADLFYKHIINE